MNTIYSFDDNKKKLAHEEFLNESLFTAIYDTIIYPIYNSTQVAIDGTLCDIDLWDEARELVKNIFSSCHPEQKVSFYFRENWNKGISIFNHQKGYHYSYLMPTLVDNLPIQVSNEITVCIFEYAFCMIYCSAALENDDTCNDVAVRIAYEVSNHGYQFDFETCIEIIHENINNGNIVKDIDYLKQGGVQFDEFGDVISSIKDTENEDEYEDDTVEPLNIDFHDKVRLELACKLMEKSGADFNQRGNKAEAARLLESFLNLPLQTCKNYLTNRDLSKTEHEEEIAKTNVSLQKLKINFTL